MCAHPPIISKPISIAKKKNNARVLNLEERACHVDFRIQTMCTHVNKFDEDHNTSFSVDSIGCGCA